MNAIILFIYVVALATWLGETVFFSFVVAPTLFGSLPVEQAGMVIGLIFPGYYAVGYVCGVLLLVTAIALRQRSGPGGGLWLAAALLAGLALAACFYAGLIIQPQAAVLRPQLHDPAAAPAVRETFDALHARAVQLNGGILLIGLTLAGLLAAQTGATMRAGGRRLSRYGSDSLL